MAKTILEAQDLEISYGDKTIIDKVSIQIEEGKIYSIIGPNGCGKTTLLKSLCRSVKPKKGKVLLYGEDIFRMNTKEVAKKLGVLSQGSNTMSDITVRQLIGFGRYAHKNWWEGHGREDETIVNWAIERTRLEKLQHKRINSLSGGERQRAWIAMSIAQKPNILLLDEPTTYLDISHQLEILNLVGRLNKEENITIVMVLHDINHAARYSDELIVIDNKKVYTKGDPWNVLEEGVLEEVFKVRAEITKDSENGKPIFYAKNVI